MKCTKYPLTILYLNKIGWFCGSCKNELLKEGLVMENEDQSSSCKPEGRTSVRNE